MSDLTLLYERTYDLDGIASESAAAGFSIRRMAHVQFRRLGVAECSGHLAPRREDRAPRFDARQGDVAAAIAKPRMRRQWRAPVHAGSLRARG